MIVPTHHGLRALFEALKEEQRSVVRWRDRLGTEALVFGETIAAAVPGGPVRTMRLNRGSFRRQVRRLALGASASTAGNAAPRRQVVLVPCGRTQMAPAVARRLHAGERVPVEEFYGSPVFRASLALAKALAPPSHIRLLSPHHGLLTLSDWITAETADDVPLGYLTDSERRAWGWRIMSELLDDYGAEPRGYLLVGGQLHKEALLDAWPIHAPQLNLVIATPASSGASRQPRHPVLRTLVELHQSLKKERAAALLWRDDDGTEAVAFGRRLFAASPGGSVHTASEPLVRRRLGRPSASIREVVREILTRRDSTAPEGAKLQNGIVEIACRAGTPISANTIASTIHRRRSVVYEAIRGLIDDGVLVLVHGGLVVSAEANPFATADEISSALNLVRVVIGPMDAARAEMRVRELEARFADTPPAASTLRALLFELRACVPQADEATNDALRRLERQLARVVPQPGRAPEPASLAHRQMPPASATPTRRRPT